jgi:serine/threonine-protein kinase RsbW
VTDVPDDHVRPSTGDHDADVVELGVPARTAYVSVLRTTAAALAARLDFTLDEIEDLKIAVDEASAMLLAQAVPDSSLSCRFELAGDELVVAVSVHSRNPRVPSRSSFAWTVLAALAGHVDTDIDSEKERATLTLTKRGEVARPARSVTSGDVRDLDDARSARRRDQPSNRPTSRMPPLGTDLGTDAVDK